MAAADRKRLNKPIQKASSVLGCPLDAVEVVGDGRMMAKLLMNHASHPMQDTLAALHISFGHRLIPPRCLKERDRKSFLQLLPGCTTHCSRPLKHFNTGSLGHFNLSTVQYNLITTVYILFCSFVYLISLLYFIFITALLCTRFCDPAISPLRD